MVMAAGRCSPRTPTRRSDEVRLGLEGNLCRCTGYQKIVKAVLACARAIAETAVSVGGCVVIPAEFDYQRADVRREAIALLAEHGDEAKLLAGGHSLLPLMKLRLAATRGAHRHRPARRPVLRP